MNYYNQFKKILSYLNFIFAIYLWILIVYAFFRWTGLINRTILQEHLLGKYLEIPIKAILNFFNLNFK